MNKKGSSLISFIIYLTLFSLISLFFCYALTALILPARKSLHNNQSLISLHLAVDLFIKDVRAVRGSSTDFKLINPQECVWHTNEKAIGWRFFEKRLERIEGVYNNGWKKKKRSVASMALKDATFSIDKHNNQAIGIEITLTPIIEAASPITGYVAL